MKSLNIKSYHQHMQNATSNKIEGSSIKRLKYLAKINPSKEEIKYLKGRNILVTFLPMEKVSEEGLVDTSMTKSLDEVWNGFTYFRVNDVIMAKITPCFENGKGALLTNLENHIGFGSTEYHVLRPNIEKMLPKYLYYLTDSYSFKKLGEGEMIGAAGQKRVPQTFLENLHILLPPINTQKLIVSFLNSKLEKINSLVFQKQAVCQGLCKSAGSG